MAVEARGTLPVHDLLPVLRTANGGRGGPTGTGTLQLDSVHLRGLEEGLADSGGHHGSVTLLVDEGQSNGVLGDGGETTASGSAPCDAGESLQHAQDKGKG